MIEIGRPPSRRRIWSVAALGILVILAVGLFFALGRSRGTAKPPFDLRTTGKPCRDDPAWTCGSIRVPFDRDTPQSASLAVEFRVLPRRNVTKSSAGTIAVVAGGPGESSVAQHAWAQRAFRSVLADHDLLLVDNRGSGGSHFINCPDAQRGFSTIAILECTKILGSRADDYGTIAATDDLDAILAEIHSSKVDLYAESYGTFFAQVFALRHPQHLQRLVLDGALPLDGDPWMRRSAPAGLADLRATCHANVACRSHGDPAALLARVLPVMRSRARLEHGASSSTSLGELVANAGRKGSAYRELPAALRAWLAGDRLPLTRLMDEAAGGGAGDVSATDSAGLLLADSCADFPQPFNPRASVTVQQNELEASFRRLIPSTSKADAPFIPKEVVRNPSICVGWPAPTHPTPQSLARHFPNVPTLVLEGSLDTVTPPSSAHMVADEFAHSTYLRVPFVGHVAARKDGSECAASIAAEFLGGRPIEADCLRRREAPAQVATFPTLFAQEPPIALEANRGASALSPDDLRVVGVTRDAVSDALWRWAHLDFSSGRGLRGGTFGNIDPAGSKSPSLRLASLRWTSDTTVTGVLTPSPAGNTLRGSVRVSTPLGPAVLRVESRIVGTVSAERITGEINRQTVDVVVNGNLGD